MGFLDKIKVQAVTLKDMAVDTAVKNSDKISDGLDKAGEFADKQTKGKYTDKIQTGKVKAKQGLEKLEAKNTTNGGSSQAPPARTETFGTTPPAPPTETFGTTPPGSPTETFGTADPAFPTQSAGAGADTASPLDTPGTTSEPAPDAFGTAPPRRTDDPEATPPPLS